MKGKYLSTKCFTSTDIRPDKQDKDKVTAVTMPSAFASPPCTKVPISIPIDIPANPPNISVSKMSPIFSPRPMFNTKTKYKHKIVADRICKKQLAAK